MLSCEIMCEGIQFCVLKACTGIASERGVVRSEAGRCMPCDKSTPRLILPPVVDETLCSK